MNPFLNVQIAERIGAALMHSVWEGTAIAAVAALLLAFRNGARARYGIACAALAAVAAAPLLTFALISSPAPAPAVLHWRPDAARVPAGVSEAAYAAAAAVNPFAWLAIAWLAGVVGFSIRLAGGWFMAWRAVRAAVPSTRLAEAAARIAERSGLRRTVRVLETASSAGPYVFGVLRPVILLPLASVTGLSAGEVEAVLAHEIGHILRRDFLVNLLQTFTETLLFYHPAVWWLSARIRDEREHCCDDVALSLCGSPRVYSEALLKLEGIRPAGLLPVAARGGSLKRRIARILGVPAPARPAGRPALAALLVTLAVLAALSFPASSKPAAEPSPAAAATQAQTRAAEPRPVCGHDSFRRWLDEDVVYLVTQAERTEMERLVNPAQCEAFIESFWKRRDPTPDTAENEFKREHYRRIIYSNERFATSKPGWTTDRGAAYIVYGPPDEIETHPEKLREMWLYRKIEGMGSDVVFEFRGEDYRLARAPSGKTK